MYISLKFDSTLKNTEEETAHARKCTILTFQKTGRKERQQFM